MLLRLSVVGLFAAAILSAESPAAVFTAAQGDAGRVAYESSCGKCHTNQLTGRTGASNELPELASLSEEMQKVVKGYDGQVPSLVGTGFMSKWATTKLFSRRIREGVLGFPPKGLNDQTYLSIAAYILQFNGARPGSQALLPDTDVELRLLNLNTPKAR